MAHVVAFRALLERRFVGVINPTSKVTRERHPIPQLARKVVWSVFERNQDSTRAVSSTTVDPGSESSCTRTIKAACRSRGTDLQP